MSKGITKIRFLSKSVNVCVLFILRNSSNFAYSLDILMGNEQAYLNIVFPLVLI